MNLYLSCLEKLVSYIFFTHFFLNISNWISLRNFIFSPLLCLPSLSSHLWASDLDHKSSFKLKTVAGVSFSQETFF